MLSICIILFKSLFVTKKEEKGKLIQDEKEKEWAGRGREREIEREELEREGEMQVELEKTIEA